MEEQENGAEQVWFALVEKPTGMYLLGQVTQKAFLGWMTNKCKLPIRYPKNLNAVPITQGEKLVGFNFAVTPVYPAKTPQERIVVDACSVELLEEIIEDDDGNVRCADKSSLFGPYQDMIRQWEAELIGIVLPKKNVVSTSGSTPIDIRRKK